MFLIQIQVFGGSFLMKSIKVFIVIAIVSVLCGCTLVGRGGVRPEKIITLNVLTYNIHTGRGIDSEFSLERIAEVINSCDADISGLQEVDRNTKRNPMDQTAVISELTGQHSAFQKNLDYQGGEYGVGVSSRFPILEVRNFHYTPIPDIETRGALAIKIKPAKFKKYVWFVTTHLGTDKTGEEQLGQVRELLEWVSTFEGKVILSGDFNQEPGSPAIKLIRQSGFADLWEMAGEGPGFTFPSINRNRRIDYLFVFEKDLENVEWIKIPDTPASDHLPMAARISLTY